jgi:hypothetical protein
MPMFKVQVDKLVVYEVEVEADTRDAALLSAVEIIVSSEHKASYLKESYDYEANYAEEVKPKTRRKE